MTMRIPEAFQGKPSVGLRAALADMEAVEKDPRYMIEMSVWHIPANKVKWFSKDESESGKCCVCLAGAVLARAGVLTPDKIYTDDEDDKDQLISKMRAIDAFRKGYVSFGLHLWHGKWLTSPEIIINVPRFYSDSDGDDMRNAFKDGIRRVIAKLEELGE